MSLLRFWTVALMLAATSLLLHARASYEVIPKSEPLAEMPRVIDGRTSSADIPIDQETLDVLGAGDFLSRVYTEPGQAPVGLFMGYFASQRSGVTIHSPKNCLPGAGWVFESSKYANVTDAEGKQHQVGEYVIANGDSRQFVIYYYLAHGRSVANEYMAKMYLVADAMRMNRTDGALVRVITPIDPREGMDGARERAETFVAQLQPILPSFIPN